MGQDIGEAPKIKSARCFTLEDLKLSTNDFREINAIGAGGYGTVIKQAHQLMNWKYSIFFFCFPSLE
jgi:hypothetical protein